MDFLQLFLLLILSGGLVVSGLFLCLRILPRLVRIFLLGFLLRFLLIFYFLLILAYSLDTLLLFFGFPYIPWYGLLYLLKGTVYLQNCLLGIVCTVLFVTFLIYN